MQEACMQQLLLAEHGTENMFCNDIENQQEEAAALRTLACCLETDEIMDSSMQDAAKLQAAASNLGFYSTRDEGDCCFGNRASAASYSCCIALPYLAATAATASLALRKDVQMAESGASSLAVS
jgi:hypothetical protein